MLVYYRLFDLLRKRGLFQKELIDNNVINCRKDTAFSHVH